MKVTVAAGRAWRYSHTLGRRTGEHNGKTGGYAWPVDVAQAPDGFLFVLSRGYGREIVGYDADVLRRIGKTSIDENHIGDFARNEFTWPSAIAVSHEGLVYVADEHENWIKVFGPDGIIEFAQFKPEGESIEKWGQPGSAPGQLQGPSGLAFDSNDDLYVVDSGNNRVQKFSKHGEFIAAWGEPGTGPGQFDTPWGVTIDRNGDVYVVDWGNNRVQKFTPAGEYLTSFGDAPGEAGELDHPAGVAVDSDGDVYVTDWGNRRVQIYGQDGAIVASLYGDSAELSKAGEYIMARNDSALLKPWALVDDDVLGALRRFERPVGLVVTPDDKIVVTDICGRLQVYMKDREYRDVTD